MICLGQQGVLEQMGEENVKIRITLSYYVKPSPGYAGRSNKYRYPSATLHFDLKSASESMEEFLCRRNKSEGERELTMILTDGPSNNNEENKVLYNLTGSNVRPLNWLLVGR